MYGRSQSQRSRTPITSSTESKYSDKDLSQTKIQDAAQQFVNVLIDANVTDPRDLQLQKNLADTVGTLSWSENLASAVLKCLESALRNNINLGKTIELALEKAVAAATGFAKDHPVYFTLIALGVLVIVAPWVLEWLGFAEIGIIEGELSSPTCWIVLIE